MDQYNDFLSSRKQTTSRNFFGLMLFKFKNAF